MFTLQPTNRTRLHKMLEAHGLDEPLTDEALALRFLILELRLDELELTLGTIRNALINQGITPSTVRQNATSDI